MNARASAASTQRRDPLGGEDQEVSRNAVGDGYVNRDVTLKAEMLERLGGDEAEEVDAASFLRRSGPGPVG